MAIARYSRCVQTGLTIDEEVSLELPGGLRHHHSTLIPVRDDQGRIHRIVGISRDLKGPSTQNPVYQRLASSLAWARQHCTDPISVADWAQHAKLSVAQLERHVLALLQLTPSRWLLSLRLEFALGQLTSNRTVAQIGIDSGFTDHSAFSRAFRRHIGISPSDYRLLKLDRA